MGAPRTERRLAATAARTKQGVKDARPSRLRWAAPFVLGVVYSLLVLAWHFPSDVLGGFCVAAAWTLNGLAAVWALEARQRGAARVQATRVDVVLAPAALAALGVAAIVGAVALARAEAALAYAEANTAFVAVATVIGTGALALAAALAAALRS